MFFDSPHYGGFSRDINYSSAITSGVSTLDQHKKKSRWKLRGGAIDTPFSELCRYVNSNTAQVLVQGEGRRLDERNPVRNIKIIYIYILFFLFVLFCFYCFVFRSLV